MWATCPAELSGLIRFIARPYKDVTQRQGVKGD